MNEVHIVQDVRVTGRLLHMVVDGVPYDVDLAEQTKRLREASEVQLTNIEVSPSGYGLHWPDIDEDLSVDGLIVIKRCGAVMGGMRGSIRSIAADFDDTDGGSDWKAFQ